MASNSSQSHIKTDVLTNGLNGASTSAAHLTNNLNEMLLNNKQSFEQWPKEKKTRQIIKLFSLSSKIKHKHYDLINN